MIERMNTGTDSTDADSGGLPDRRGTGRFPVREDVRYRVVQSRTAKVSGVGSTLNIGSGGILVTTEDKLPLGLMVGVECELAGDAGWHMPSAIRRHGPGGSVRGTESSRPDRKIRVQDAEREPLHDGRGRVGAAPTPFTH